MARLTMPDLLGVKETMEMVGVDDVDILDGRGDFEVTPESFEMAQLREAERMWRERALAAEGTLRQVRLALSQPLKKCKKADLEKLIGVTLDVVDSNDWSLFSKGITE